MHNSYTPLLAAFHLLAYYLLQIFTASSFFLAVVCKYKHEAKRTDTLEYSLLGVGHQFAGDFMQKWTASYDCYCCYWLYFLYDAVYKFV